MSKQKKKAKQSMGRAPTYAELLAEEEYDNLKEIARTHRINKALAGRRCPPAEGVIRLIKQKGIRL